MRSAMNLSSQCSNRYEPDLPQIVGYLPTAKGDKIRARFYLQYFADGDGPFIGK